MGDVLTSVSNWTFWHTSFKRQLTLIVTLGVLLLAITSAMVTAWMASSKMRSMLLNEGLQVTESLARQAPLALIYESGENAADAVAATLSFPAVSNVQIVNGTGNELVNEGESGGYQGKINPVSEQAGMLAEDTSHWYFSAPVYSVRPDEQHAISAVVSTEGMSEVLGQVVVSVRKAQLREIQRTTIVNNLLVALVIAGLLVMLLRRMLTRMTDPLDRLSDKMARAEQGEQGVTVHFDGPLEIVRIADAFNRMTDALAERDARLREHNNRLEHEVALRTEQLVHARDVAIEANRNKSEFLSRMSHELRTPLQGIIGYTDVLREALLEEGMPRELRDVDTILHNAEHLLGLINDILDLSRIESGRLPLNVTAVSLVEVVHKAEEAVGVLVRKNNNTLVVRLSAVDAPLLLDGTKLSQVLINLLGNAAKFTHDGTIVLQAAIESGWLRITVQDTGIGIEEQFLAIIFEPFRQVDGSDTRQYEGTGLGLAITRQFCELMGGSVRVESKVGKGTLFVVELPVQSAEGVTETATL